MSAMIDILCEYMRGEETSNPLDRVGILQKV